MSYSISEVEDDLSGIVHGKTVNKITNLPSAERRAARNLLAKIDPDETRRITQITLYDKVLDYAVPTDLKEKRIVDIRPQYDPNNSRNASDNLGNRLSKDFDLRRGWGSWFTLMNDGGTPYIRVKAQLTPEALTLDDLTVLDGWVAIASAQNLAVEDIIHQQGALQFDIAAGASGYIQSSTITSQDFTDLVNVSSAFLELYIPTATALAAIISIDLQWGNDNTTNFYNRTITTPHLGSLKVGKNLLRFDWNGSTKHGIPDNTKIDSSRITINTNSTPISALIVSNLFFSIGRIWDMEYYSKYLFSDSGIWSPNVTDGDTTINLDEASYNLFLYELALAGLQQIQGKDAKTDRDYFYKELYGDGQEVEGLYPLYKKNNPSQTEKPTQTYYSNLGWRNRGNGMGIRF